MSWDLLLNIDLARNWLTATWCGVHESRLTDLTLEMWTPKFRWIPAHLMHKNIPKFHEAHRGPEKQRNGPWYIAIRMTFTASHYWFFLNLLANGNHESFLTYSLFMLSELISFEEFVSLSTNLWFNWVRLGYKVYFMLYDMVTFSFLLYLVAYQLSSF